MNDGEQMMLLAPESHHMSGYGLTHLSHGDTGGLTDFLHYYETETMPSLSFGSSWIGKKSSYHSLLQPTSPRRVGIDHNLKCGGDQRVNKISSARPKHLIFR